MNTIAALSSVSQMLGCLLLGEGSPAECVGDLRDAIIQLRSELDDIQKFLEDHSDTNNNSISREFKKQLLQLAYDIEYAVESYILRKTKFKEKPGIIRWFSRGLKSLRKDVSIFTRRIDNIKHLIAGNLAPAQTNTGGGVGTVSSVGDASTSSSVGGGGGGGGTVSSAGDANTSVGGGGGGGGIVSSTGDASPSSIEALQRDFFIGVEEDLNILKHRLIRKEPSLSVIGICGMGGAGKSSFAQLLYNNALVESHFNCRVWVVLRRQSHTIDILRISRKDEMTNIGATLLTERVNEQLRNFLKGKRYLVVLDNVWSTEAWHTTKKSLPDDGNGSRVVIITRDRDVAEEITSPPVYQMRMMPDDYNLWLLRTKIGLPNLGAEMNPETNKIVNQVIRQCGGNQLAITFISNILKSKKLEDWDVALHELQAYPNLGTVEEILHLSYKQLPVHLRSCFVHLGQFPPNQAIPVDKLYSMWIAEGLISTRDVNNKSRTEVAESYLNELIDRDLVIAFPVEEVPVIKSRKLHDLMRMKEVPRNIKSCQLDDLTRDLCLSKVKEEEFLEVLDLRVGNNISPLTRRLAIYLNNSKDENGILPNIPEAEHIRSILFFDTDESKHRPTRPVKLFDLKKFRQTRVLDFDGVDFRVKKLGRGIEKLIYLRYLSFQGCYLQKLPSSLSTFPFLETLDLRVSCMMTIPNVLWKLSSLRHLYFPVAYQSDKRDKLKVNGLINLEILENFHTGICDADDLLQLKKLQILTCIVDGNGTELLKAIAFINGSKNLCHSSLIVKHFDCYSKDRPATVSALLKCDALHVLDIEGYLDKSSIRGAFGSNFSRMVFNGSEFDVDPMPILGKLPNLRGLVLCNMAFVGTEMVCSESDFTRLTSLELVNLRSLVFWVVEIGALQNLIVLTVERCNKLQTLPHGLIGLPTLQKMMIGSMPNEFQGKVNKIIKDRLDRSFNGPDVTYYDC